jgi:ABC-type nitrate/sulfonate/bicarbonate transport system substrate-binding protein
MTGDQPLSRREFLARATAAAATTTLGGSVLAGCGSSGAKASARTIRTQFTYFLDVTYSGWYLANTYGYMQREKVKSVMLPGGPNLPPIEGLVAAGSVDVGMGDTQGVALANRQGADLVVFAAQYQNNPGGLVSLAKNPVRRAEDLVGKRIGITAGGGAEQRVQAIFKVNHLPLKYTPVRITGEPQALIEGVCDVMVCYVTAQPVALTLKGVPNVAVTLSELGVPDYGDVLFSTRRYIEANRELMASYLRAVIEGWERNLMDPTVAAQIAVRNVGRQLGVTEAQELAENRAQIPLMQSSLTAAKGLFWVDPERLAGPIYDGFRAAGISNLPKPETLMDLSVLEHAFQGKTKLLAA